MVLARVTRKMFRASVTLPLDGTVGSRSSHTVRACVSTVLNFMCHLCPQGYMEPFSHHSCVKNSGIDDLTVTVFGNVIDLLYLHQ